MANIREIEPGLKYQVESSRLQGKWYTISRKTISDAWRCECPGYIYHQDSPCRHISDVTNFVDEHKVEIQAETQKQEEENSLMEDIKVPEEKAEKEKNISETKEQSLEDLEKLRYETNKEIKTIREEGKGVPQELLDKYKSIKEKIKSKAQNGNVITIGSQSVSKGSKIDIKILIPKTDEGYIPRKLKGKSDLRIMQLAHKNKTPIMITGDTGSGKSLSVTAFAYKMKLPILGVNLNGATSYEELVGQFVPDTKGNLFWQDGILTTMVRQGGILLLNEINVINSELNFVMNGLTERNKNHRKLIIPQTGEIINAHENLWVVATMNEGFSYEGTKPLNVAFSDRFGVYLEFKYEEKIEKQLEIPTRLLSVAKLCRESNEIETPVSTATLVEWKNGIEIYGEKLASEICFINKFRNEDEKKIAKETCDMVLYKRNRDASIDTTDDKPGIINVSA